MYDNNEKSIGWEKKSKVDLSDYATKEEVKQEILNAQLGGEGGGVPLYRGIYAQGSAGCSAYG